MDINIENYKSYKHIAQQIYDIIIKNNEKYTKTLYFILSDYASYSTKTKMELKEIGIYA